jgi:hypothetical protein
MITPELIEKLQVELTRKMVADKLLQAKDSEVTVMALFLLLALEGKTKSISVSKRHKNRQLTVFFHIEVNAP